MKISNKIHVVCGSIGAQAYILVKDNRFYTYCNQMAVIIDYNDRADEILTAMDGMFIHKDTFKAIHNKELVIKNAQIYCEKIGMYLDLIHPDELNRMKIAFPDIQALMDQRIMPKATTRFSVNADYVKKAGEVLDCLALTIEYRGEANGMYVKPLDSITDSELIIMPIADPEWEGEASPTDYEEDPDEEEDFDLKEHNKKVMEELENES